MTCTISINAHDIHVGVHADVASSTLWPTQLATCTISFSAYNGHVGLHHYSCPSAIVPVRLCACNIYDLFQSIPVHGVVCMQEVKREQMEEQRRAAAAARQEIKEDKKPKQAAAGPAPSMALRTAASLQRALSNDDDGMFWDYGPAAGQRGMTLLCKFP